jgi:tRNA (guanine-N7-)-methyltransferase
MNAGSADESVSPRRSIRSFVKRSGRLTIGQQQALKTLWPLYGMEYQPSHAPNWRSIFDGLDGLKLEIGFGNGDSLVEMAANDPAFGYIGIEVHEPGVGHCLKTLHDAGITNLRLISHDAMDVIECMIPDACLDAVFLFFPDPWHKKKHHKRRIVNQAFRDQLVRVLKPGGVVHMATDWQDYSQHMAEDMLGDQRFLNMGNESGYAPKPDYRPQTKFERRGLRLGHGVWDLLFRRI